MTNNAGRDQKKKCCGGMVEMIVKVEVEVEVEVRVLLSV